MIDEIKEVKEVTEIKETVVARVRKCDVCGKVIRDSRDKIKTGKRTDYWKLTTGHNDWGNDSIESIESFDICSPKCLQKKFDEYIKDSDNECNSWYFEVSHE